MHADGKSTLASFLKWNSEKVNCCRSRLALDHKLLTNLATVAKKNSQNISKSLVCHRFKGVFYLTLRFYTLDL